MKLLRTIRLDPSDAFVFARAAEPGEWAVTGTFRFLEAPPDLLIGKARAAFRSGWLGISSLGWSTLAIVSEASAPEREAAVAALASQLMAHFGAPDRSSALAAAEEEIAFSGELAAPDVGTLVAIHRSLEDGEIKERVRTLLPGTDAQHGRAFSFLLEDASDDAAAEDAVNLAGLLAEPKALP